MAWIMTRPTTVEEGDSGKLLEEEETVVAPDVERASMTGKVRSITLGLTALSLVAFALIAATRRGLTKVSPPAVIDRFNLASCTDYEVTNAQYSHNKFEVCWWGAHGKKFAYAGADFAKAEDEAHAMIAKCFTDNPEICEEECSWTLEPQESCPVGSRIADKGITSLDQCKLHCEKHGECTDINWQANVRCEIFRACASPTASGKEHYEVTRREL